MDHSESSRRWAMLNALALTITMTFAVTYQLTKSSQYERGVCDALTGNSSCDWRDMRLCNPPETTGRVPLPCVVVVSPVNEDNISDHVIVYMDHKCPDMLDDVQCINTEGPEYDD
jgi:hypothetical protein